MRPLTDRFDSLRSDAETDQTGLRATSATERRSVVAQQPQWPDVQAVALVEDHLASLAPLTAEHEVDALAGGLALASEGRALVLQAGDCAEQFVDARRDLVRRKIDHLHSLSASMRVSADLPVVTIGRIAGQYGKPRSSSTEITQSGELIASYRGDAVNSFEPNAGTRVPDPARLLTAYRCASSTLAEIRESWSGKHSLERVYASHEMLLMPYECPLVREGRRGMCAASTHFGWIGERTRGFDGAHLEFARSVTNPVGVKLGPSATPEDAVALSRRLNPDGSRTSDVHRARRGRARQRHARSYRRCYRRRWAPRGVALRSDARQRIRPRRVQDSGSDLYRRRGHCIHASAPGCESVACRFTPRINPRLRNRMRAEN